LEGSFLPSSHDIIWHWLRQGWKYRRLGKNPEYARRVKYEMGLIESKDFVDYFLIVSDLVRYAKDSGYAVGPARGSAAASLVCWLLRITEVNPMLYPNLVFERFIDVSRADLPDIDLDFESECRYDLYNYCVAKYGAECVANIGTFTYYRAKNSLDDVARVHRIPVWDVGTVKDRIITRSSGDLRASDTIEDTIEQFPDVADVFARHPELALSAELEGNVKGQSVHAAGLVLSGGPLRRVAPVYGRRVAGELREVLVFDKYDAERQGMLKIDILGLSTMSMIAECLRWINITLPELYALPLDDERVYDAFRANDVVGVFQFDGLTQKGVCGQLKPDNFDELCDINALARPGPLHNGAVSKYVDIKRGAAEPEALHPLFDAITASTHGQAVYQEQILRAVTEIGMFDWTSASYIRKIMSRKLGEQEFARQGEQFAWGAAQNGVPEEVALRIWAKCVTAGSYAFNAAHCVSYAMIGYWCMWLKVYHPHEFYAASLTHTATGVDRKKGINKPVDMIRDAIAHNVTVLPPDLQQSGLSWAPVRDGVRMGFTQIPGIGEVVAQQIVAWRDEAGIREFAGWEALTAIKGIGPKTVERIVEFASKQDPFGASKMGRDIMAVKRALRDDPALVGLPIPTHTAAEFQQDPRARQVVWVGTVHGRNLRDLFEYHLSRTGEELDPATVKDPQLNESGMRWRLASRAGSIPR
jgi:DNA polymerase-3 subunit alpha